MVDPRLKPGNVVEALACRLMNKAECARQFGALHRTTKIKGVVVEAVKRKNATTGRNINNVIVDFDFGFSDLRRKEVSLRVLEKFEAPEVAEGVAMGVEGRQQPPPTELVTQQGDNNINNILADMIGNNDNDDASNSINDINITNISPNDLLGRTNGINNNTTPETMTTNTENVATTSPMTPDRRITHHMDSPFHRNVVASAHGYDWHDEPAQLYHEIGERHRYRSWSLQTAIGDIIRAGENCDEKYSRLDVFLMMFPPKQLEIMQQLTSRKLVEKNLTPTTIGEIIRFFGSLILITRYEFTTRASLWSTHPPTKYETAPMFGLKTKFTRKRFNELFSNIRFGDQPDQKPDHLTSEQYRWLLVDGFVTQFNNHRRDTFKPSDVICVDESISRWYGQGGDWINHGLPMYIAIDRKPENGCEIQDSCCGKSGVMLQLLVVKTKREQENSLHVEANENHGTAVLKKLVSAWAFSERIVCADSYFASVNCCEALREMGLKFVGVVKTATKKFPMNRLATTRLHQRGDRYGLVHKNPLTGRPNLIAFVWLDRERRYFISSGPCLVEGTPYIVDGGGDKWKMSQRIIHQKGWSWL